MKIITGALMVAAIVVTSVATHARALSPKEKAIIEDSAKQQMKDPESAKFFWQDYQGGNTYCAHVNAKNSYGGYSGKALLIVGVKLDNAGKIQSADTFIHDGDTQKMMSPICVKAGYQP